MALSITNSLSLRIFYSSTPALALATNRKDATNGALSYADSKALRTAIRRLEDYDFDGEKEDAVQEKLKAFVDTYNNTLETGKKYSVNDTAISNAVSKLKSLSSSHSDELKNLGITIEKGTGYLKLSDSAAKNITRSKFTDFFTSKDNEYLEGVYNAARHMSNRIDVQL